MARERHILMTFVLAGLALPVCTPAFAAGANGAATARIRTPVTLVATRQIDFGKIVRGTTAGTVTLNAQTGARTSTGGVVLIGTGFATAAFTATSEPSTLVRITAVPTSISLARIGGGATMVFNTLRVSINGAGQQTLPRNFTMPATGTRNFTLGGRLNVAANQLAGVYQGVFAITVNYQ